MNVFNYSRRGVFWLLLIFIPLLGLGTRTYAALFPLWWALYAPDALWALLVFVLVTLVAPRFSPRTSALYALAISYLIEASQLYQAPWINAIRATRLGGLILGHGFLWSDILCYTVGVGCGLGFALWLERTSKCNVEPKAR